jgi:outer membrane protein assembly factor BamB
MKTIVILSLCLAPGAVLRAAEPSADPMDNWHQWRGPLANGVAVRGDPPVHWDAQTNIKWKAELPGRGVSTPIVWGDQVFVLTAVDTKKPAGPKDLPRPDPRFEKKTQPTTTYHQFVVLCIDRATGKVRWQRIATEQVPHEGHHPTHSYAAGSPTTDGRSLYVSFGSWGIYCFDLTGQLRWKRDLGRLNTRLGWGEAITPVVHGDTLIVNWDQEADSFITALDARTGETRWKVPRDEASTWNTPLVVPHNGRTQVIVNGTKRVRSYDLADGRLLWQCGGQTVNPIPSPVADDRRVYCVSGYRGSAALALPLDASGDLTDSDKIVWRYARGTPYVPSPLLAGDRLYFTQANTPMLTCLDAATGKVLINQERLPNLQSLYASPVCAADRIYLPSREGTTLVFKRSDKLEVLAVNRLDDPIDASPAVAGRQLFLRGDKYLYCIEEEKGGR